MRSRSRSRPCTTHSTLGCGTRRNAGTADGRQFRTFFAAAGIDLDPYPRSTVFSDPLQRCTARSRTRKFLLGPRRSRKANYPSVSDRFAPGVRSRTYLCEPRRPDSARMPETTSRSPYLRRSRDPARRERRRPIAPGNRLVPRPPGTCRLRGLFLFLGFVAEHEA